MHPSPAVQVIERNLNQFESFSNLLVFGPPDNFHLAGLKIGQVSTFDYRVYRSIADFYGDAVKYSEQPTADLNADAAIVFLPKAKQELALVLAFIAPMLAANAAVFLVGEKQGGIESAAKQLQVFGSRPFKLDSARHCQLWQVQVTVPAKAFDLNDWMQVYEAQVAGLTLKVATVPGVFSAEHLDGGTALLLDNLPDKFIGRVLDFGCGSGVIGVFAKLRQPELIVEMVDIHRLALVCSERTCQLNGVQAKVYPSEGWSDVTGRVDAVITNPPFHAGIRTEYDTSENFIRQAPQHMSKFSPLVLVANSFLKYAPLIEQVFGSCETVAETSKFRVYLARR
jgi:16S rRNA (guanine1207-N2)-methyltransferase